MKLVALLALAACGTSSARIITLEPDAALDAHPCVPPTDASAGCCALMPDVSAVAVCVTAQLRAGECADLFCQALDCSLTEVPACGASGDAGVDGGLQ